MPDCSEGALVVVVAGIAFLLLAGLVSFMNMQVNNNPDIDFRVDGVKCANSLSNIGMWPRYVMAISSRLCPRRPASSR